MNRLLALGFALGLATPPTAAALPALDALTLGKLATTTSNHGVRFLQDDDDPDLYYALPSALIVARDDAGSPLFRVAVSENGAADVVLIARVIPASGFETAFERLRQERPAARLALLPVTSGTLTVTLVEAGGSASVVAEGNTVINAYLNADMPLTAHIPAAAVERLRVLASTPNGAVVSFGYRFAFYAREQGESQRFRIKRSTLRSQFLSDADFMAAAERGTSLTQEWLQRQVMRAIGFSFGTGKSIIPLDDLSTDPSYLYRATLAMKTLIPRVLYAEPPADLLSAESLRRLSREPTWSGDDIVEVTSEPSRMVRLVRAQAGGTLRGICRADRSLVYKYGGVISCAALVPSGDAAEEPAPGPGTNPDPDTNDPRPNPDFDPILDD